MEGEVHSARSKFSAYGMECDECPIAYTQDLCVEAQATSNLKDDIGSSSLQSTPVANRADP